MRIMVGTDVTIGGGVDIYVLALLTALRQRGHEVLVLVEEGSESRIGAGARAQGIEVLPVPLYRRWHKQSVIEGACRSQLAAVQPDGIHVVTGSPRSCFILRGLAVEMGIPLVITEQQIAQNVRLSEGERDKIRDSYAAAAAVVFVSAGNRDTMAQAVGLEDVRSLIITNGVDLQQLAKHRKAVHRPSTPARLVSVARLSPEKSLSTLVDAVKLLPQGLVREVNIYGDGEERSSLDERIRRLGLCGRISLRGWDDDVVRVLCRHDLFVLPSVAEGMPHALLEAMAVGVPAIGTDVPGNAEALAGGSAGVIVRQANPQALADGIRRCLEDPDLAERKALTALTLVHQRHDRALAMERTVRIWDDMTGGGAGRPSRGHLPRRAG